MKHALFAVFIWLCLADSLMAQMIPGVSSPMIPNATSGGGSFPPSGCSTSNGVIFNNATPCDSGFTYAGSGGQVSITGNLSFNGGNTSVGSVNGTSLVITATGTSGYVALSGASNGGIDFLVSGGTEVARITNSTNGLWSLTSTTNFGWASNSPGGSNDTVLSRKSAGVVQVGTTTTNDSGTLDAAGYQVGGSAGASCTLTVVAHLTVVNGLVTLCN
jgi:hypothetical protein